MNVRMPATEIVGELILGALDRPAFHPPVVTLKQAEDRIPRELILSIYKETGYKPE